MPHIPLPPGLPGIRGPMAFRPETAKPINELANILLFEPHSLSRGERELIATHVSCANECQFCQTIHGAYAAHFLGDEALVLQAKVDPESAALPPKLKALLNIAGKVARSGRDVTADDIARARGEGATDLEIHDTVLIAALQAHGWDDEAIYFAISVCALFNFYNRWITATGVPEMSPEAHKLQGKNLARGYVRD